MLHSVVSPQFSTDAPFEDIIVCLERTWQFVSREHRRTDGRILSGMEAKGGMRGAGDGVRVYRGVGEESFLC